MWSDAAGLQSYIFLTMFCCHFCQNFNLLLFEKVSALTSLKHPTAHNPDGCFCFKTFPPRLELEVLVVIFLSLKCTFDICLLFLLWLQCNKVTPTKYLSVYKKVSRRGSGGLPIKYSVRFLKFQSKYSSS